MVFLSQKHARSFALIKWIKFLKTTQKNLAKIERFILIKWPSQHWPLLLWFYLYAQLISDTPPSTHPPTSLPIELIFSNFNHQFDPIFPILCDRSHEGKFQDLSITQPYRFHSYYPEKNYPRPHVLSQLRHLPCRAFLWPPPNEGYRTAVARSRKRENWISPLDLAIFSQRSQLQMKLGTFFVYHLSLACLTNNSWHQFDGMVVLADTSIKTRFDHYWCSIAF